MLLKAAVCNARKLLPILPPVLPRRRAGEPAEDRDPHQDSPALALLLSAGNATDGGSDGTTKPHALLLLLRPGVVDDDGQVAAVAKAAAARIPQPLVMFWCPPCRGERHLPAAVRATTADR